MNNELINWCIILGLLFLIVVVVKIIHYIFEYCKINKILDYFDNYKKNREARKIIQDCYKTIKQDKKKGENK